MDIRSTQMYFDNVETEEESKRNVISVGLAFSTDGFKPKRVSKFVNSTKNIMMLVVLCMFQERIYPIVLEM